MSKTNNFKPHAVILRLTLAVCGLALAVVGILLSNWGDFLKTSGSVDTLTANLIDGAASVVLISGALGIASNLFLAGAQARARREEQAEAFRENAPEIADAVLRIFADSPDSLKRVATPEMLDTIAANALGLRLGDRHFAREVYADLVENVIRAPERWSGARSSSRYLLLV